MKSIPAPYELRPEDLRLHFSPSRIPAETTEEIEPLQGIIGQERAVRAMEFGLRVKHPGYNIFMAGPTGTGKNTYARRLIHEVARREPVPDDWIYLYNFENPDEPLALNLPPGMGSKLAQDMDELVEELKVEVPRRFDSDDYEKQRDAVIREFQEQSQALIDEAEKVASEHGFALRRTSTGFATVPLVDGRPITQEEFEALPEERRKALEAANKEIHSHMADVTRRIRALEKQAKERVRELERQVALAAVSQPMAELREKYASVPGVIEYLTAVEKDIIENIDEFKDDEEAEAPVPWMRRRSRRSFVRYKVNLLVDNHATQGAPVVIEANPTFANLFGKLEYRHEFGAMVTDFTMIKAGALHQANGGYLILQAQDVLKSPWSWDGLKRALKSGEVRVESVAEQMGMLPVSTLKPQPIPVRVKVILVGSPYLYHLLLYMDEEFRKYFKVLADFDVEMPLDDEHALKYAQFVAAVCRRDNLRPFHRDAIARIIEYSARMAEHKQRLSTRFNEIVEVVYEASAWADADGAPVVRAAHVDRAIREKEYRSNRVEEKLQQLLAEGQILVDVDGEKVGQVNGLSVIELGDHSFAKPTRITASVAIGDRGVINIEREVELSGRIHDKGVLILAGYLADKYPIGMPLALSASLAFEQLYEEIDGDSASSAELYALLSSLAGVPLRQGIAVTGSVNQKGEIQPVGAINRKIEGFFDLCRIKGLTGRQGVIIPKQNVVHLILKDEVLEAVRKGSFHIYAVSTIDEGLEILTGMEAGQPGPDGLYPEESFNGRVWRQLEAMSRRMAEFGRGAGGGQADEEDDPDGCGAPDA
ncbi:ATP-binding protein [Carboxydochorda subterranea]|uniref:endopeptidase La n=1 Tax=Carboxydichorda subterranea TaxID=3109565 RepID=A0ABZ1BV91_9FIRM|nr:ATP-binding protein [Limnochorda sp. L945t]WRP16441.1 ATP-binding protein [Limnochorda sp. L945t]